MATARRSEDLLGANIDGYRIESLVGVGAMAAVYRATSPRGRVVAMKVIKPEFARNETFRRRFAREAWIARSIRHPRVVELLDVGEASGMPYLAARFLEGGSLQDKLAREVWLDVKATIRMCLQVAEGLHSLHDAGMIHRDVKPANILLDQAGDAYITDFGLAKDADGTLLTGTGETLGSLQYMAPEQIRGETVTPASDTYSLGCVAYECLAGHSPFADRQAIAILWAHLNQDPPDTGRAGLPPELNEALKRALLKDPAERPASTVAYAHMLAEAAGISVGG